MSKRARVPAALHSELEEYASLVRALRTSKTLDLASHLTQYSQTQRSVSEGTSSRHSAADYENDVEEDTSNDKSRRTTSPPPVSDLGVHDYDEDGEEEIDRDIEPTVGKGKGKAKTQVKAKSKPSRVASFNERDVWTRWPLLAGDVHVPAWGLDDEVAALSTYISRAQREKETNARRASASGLQTGTPPEVHEDHMPIESALEASPGILQAEGSLEAIDAELETEDERSHLPHLAASTAYTLSRILTLLAQYVPRVEKSLRNRLAPLDWTAVLQAARDGDLGLDTNSIERLSKRLESIYGPVDMVRDQAANSLNETASQTRYQNSAERVEELMARFDKEEGCLLSFFGPRPSSQQFLEPKKKRRRRNKPQTDVS